MPLRPPLFPEFLTRIHSTRLRYCCTMPGQEWRPYMAKRKPKLPTDQELSRMKVKDLPFVRVYWDDSCSLTGWRSHENIREQGLVPVVSTGQLIKRGANEFTLITCYSGSNLKAHIIAKSLIRKVEILNGEWVQCQSK